MFSFRSMSAKPMTPRPILRVSRVFCLDDVQGEVVGVDDVVQEVHRAVDHVPRAGIVDLAAGDHLGQVERPQVAGLVGQQRLLAAGVGGFDLPQVGDGVAPVDGVQEDDAGLAGGPGALDDEVEERARR